VVRRYVEEVQNQRNWGAVQGSVKIEQFQAAIPLGD
jgi:hypothetical protein